MRAVSSSSKVRECGFFNSIFELPESMIFAHKACHERIILICFLLGQINLSILPPAEQVNLAADNKREFPQDDLGSSSHSVTPRGNPDECGHTNGDAK